MMNISPQMQAMLWLQLWQVTLLVVVVGLVAVTTLRRRPHVAYLLWALLFVKCLMPPMWSSPTGVFSWLQTSPYAVSDTLDQAFGLSTAQSEGPAKRLLLERQLAQSHGAASSEVVVTSSVQASDIRAPARSVWGFVVATGVVIWALGAGLLLSFAFFRFRRLARTLAAGGCHASPELEAALQRLARRLGIRRPIRLVISPDNDGPLVMGIFRPLIVLPEIMVESKSVTQLETILAHELIHVRRGDTLLGALQFLAQVVWWFHPLIWWASRQVNRVCERCCDAEVIASLNCQPRDYATALLDVLEFKSALRPALTMPGVRAVDITKNRVKFIMNESERFRPQPAKIYWLFAVILAFVVLPGGALLIGNHGSHQASATTSTDLADKWRSDARIAMAVKDWGTATRALGKIVDRCPNDARSWFLMGYALHADGRLDEAIKVHLKATEFPSTRVLALYNLSCAFALKGDKERSLRHLAESIDAGFISSIAITEDTDFRSLLDDPTFQEYAARAQPPSSREVYRQLDFWVGDWNVATKSGEAIGRSVVTIDVKGFLLTEKWTNTKGGTGTSISFYDPGTQKWRQTWVDERGTVVRYTGEFDGQVMRLDGKRTMANGKEMLCRKRYTPCPDGTIWQVSECSDDEGSTWSVYFDGVYRRNATMVIQVEETSV